LVITQPSGTNDEGFSVVVVAGGEATERGVRRERVQGLHRRARAACASVEHEPLDSSD
jgi:hypothetical protein